MWQFVRNDIGEDWVQLAVYLGFPRTLIDSIKVCIDQHTLRRQLRHFMTVWRVPDCGKSMEDVLHSMNEQLQKWRSGCGCIYSYHIIVT